MEIFGTIVVLMIGLGIVGGAIAYGRAKVKQFVAAMKYIEDRYNLLIQEGSLWKAAKASGTYDGLSMTIDTYTVDKSTFTRVRVEGDLPKEIFIESEGMKTSFKKLFVGDDVEIGAERFDAEAYVKGDPIDVLSYMNSEARHAIEMALVENTTLEDGVIKMTTSGIVTDPHELGRMVKLATQMASKLKRNDRSQARRLSEIVRTDKLSTLRQRAMKVLIDQYSNLPLVQTLAEEVIARSDEQYERHGDLVLDCARFLGAKARPAVVRLVRNFKASFRTRAAALRLLVQYSKTDQEVRACLELAFKDRAGLVISTALEIARARQIVLEQALLDGFQRHEDPMVRAAVASATLVSLDPNAQARLVSLVDDRDESVAMAAAEALADIGTTDCIPTLEARASRSSSKVLKAAFRDSVRTIQTRVAPGLQGGLAITDALGDGRLSQIKAQTEGDDA